MTTLRQIWQRHEEASWIKRIKAGEQHLFRSLVERYQRPIYGCIRGMVHSHDLADDLTQETFIKAFHQLERFDDQYPFFPWLRRIAVNSALTALSSVAVRRRNPLDETQPAEDDLEQQMEQSDLLEHVHRALSQLPEEQRLVFVLRTQQEMSYEEIADHLNISLGTVMSRLSRARKRLKEVLEDDL
jgi:RNA polymerase sigma-70 factor (ECF subfamily)